MIAPAPCPERICLAGLLDGSLSDDEQARLTRHLDECTLCQQALETLAGGGSWVGAPPRGDDVAPTSALRLAMAELRGETAAFLDETPPTEDGPLHFLAPPVQPGALGRFGPYDVIAFLGRGGMGLVFKAFDPALGRFVALKVLAPQLATSATARRRFAREARAAAAIRHEHVVPIYEVNSSGGLPYLVMQYVPGQSLQQRLDREGALPLEEVVRIGKETATGLAAAHACGLVHRDVKPANILLEEGSGHVWLTDFGLARTGDDVALTQSGYLAGTPQYMAPEQARGEAIDHRADLFSLGSVLYALCTGRPPFEANSTLALLRRVSDEPPPSVRSRNPNVPNWLVEIMTCLHSKSPARRYQSAAEVARLLDGQLTRMNQEPAPRPAAAPPRRRRPVLVALMALVLGLLTATELVGFTHLVEWAATVLRVRTPEGTLVVRVDDPAIEVTVDGSEVQISGDGIAEVRVRAGKHEVKATKGNKVVERKLVEIHRDDKVVVRVTLEPAAPAQAREDETKRPLPPLPEKRTPPTLPQVSKNPRILPESHSGPVHLVVFSPDGKLLASWGEDGAIRLIETSTGRTRAVLKAGRIVSMDFFPTGQILAAVDDEGIVQLWSVAIGKMVSEVKLGRSATVGRLSLNTRRLATVDAETVRLWDADSGKEILRLKKPEARIRSLAFSPDGKHLATGHSSGIVCLWDPATGREIRELRELGQATELLAFSPDGRKLAVGGKGKPILLMDVRFGITQPLLPSEAQPRGVAFSPDGKMLVVATEKNLTIVDLASGKIVDAIRNPIGAINCLAFSLDGKRVAVGDDKGRVLLWDLEEPLSRTGTAAEVEALQKQLAEERARNERLRADALRREQQALYASQLTQAQADFARALEVREQGKTALSRELLGRIPDAQRGWEWHYLRRGLTDTNNRVLVVREGPIRSVAVSPDGKLLAMTVGPRVSVYSLADRKELFAFTVFDQDATSIVFSPDGKFLAAASTDGAVRILDVPDHKQSWVFRSNRQSTHALAYHPNGSALAVGGADGQVRLITLVADKVKVAATFKIDGSPVQSLAFSPDGRTLAVATNAGSVRLFLVAAQKDLTQLPGHKGGAHAVVFSPDGKLVVSAGADRMQLADAKTGKVIRGFNAGASAATALAFSPDGRRIAAGSADGPIRLWDPATGENILTLRDHKDAVTALAFTPDGKTLVSGSKDRSVRLWLTSSEK